MKESTMMSTMEFTALPAAAHVSQGL